MALCPLARMTACSLPASERSFSPAMTSPSAFLPPVPVAPSAAVRASRAAAVALLLALVALCVAWELWLAPVRPGGSWLALKALPLCIPLAGLLKHRMYTYRWLSLMVWLYFCEGVVRATSDRVPSRYYALAEVLLCLALFVACVIHIRLRQKAAAAHPSEAPLPFADTEIMDDDAEEEEEDDDSPAAQRRAAEPASSAPTPH